MSAMRTWTREEAETAVAEGITASTAIRAHPDTPMVAGILDALGINGPVTVLPGVYPDEHFVTFDADGWFVEHSLSCRVAGTLGTCEYNAAIRRVADEPPDPDDFGRWRITAVNEGLPDLERADA